MSEQGLRCPNCSGTVAVGEITCPNCGVNLRTGESFEDKVKRGRPREVHPEHFRRGVYFAFAALYAVVMVGGYLYQRRVEGVFRKDKEGFRLYFKAVEEFDALVAAGRTDEAREISSKLIEVLDKRDRRIKIEHAPTTRQLEDPNRLPKSVRWAEKRLVRNLRAKVQYKQSRLPGE